MKVIDKNAPLKKLKKNLTDSNKTMDNKRHTHFN